MNVLIFVVRRRRVFGDRPSVLVIGFGGASPLVPDGLHEASADTLGLPFEYT
jgi:hypothetical protein